MFDSLNGERREKRVKRLLSSFFAFRDVIQKEGESWKETLKKIFCSRFYRRKIVWMKMAFFSSIFLMTSRSRYFKRMIPFKDSRNQKVQLRENVFPTSSHVKVREIEEKQKLVGEKSEKCVFDQVTLNAKHEEGEEMFTQQWMMKWRRVKKKSSSSFPSSLKHS